MSLLKVEELIMIDLFATKNNACPVFAPGAVVYKEEYRLANALEMLAALRARRPIPPDPTYG